MARYILGDVIAIILFALLARLAHNSEALPFSVQGVADTAWPFLIGLALGWAVIVCAKMQHWRVAPAGVTVWILSVITGLSIWGIRHDALPHWSFIIVASVMSFILIIGWRALAMKMQKKAVI